LIETIVASVQSFVSQRDGESEICLMQGTDTDLREARSRMLMELTPDVRARFPMSVRGDQLIMARPLLG
jgi:hypothetical protein